MALSVTDANSMGGRGEGALQQHMAEGSPTGLSAGLFLITGNKAVLIYSNT